jgi:CubicO group peptidase (beta-lactamase class C family)
MKLIWLFLAFALLAETAPMTAQQPFDFLAANAYTKAARGDALLVMHQGKIVFEDYHNGYVSSEPHLLASGTKSFSGAMLVAAIEDGLVRDMDELVAETILEWRGSPKEKISLRQLLNLTSGLEAGVTVVPPSYADSIAVPLKTPAFDYGAAPFQIFGEVMRRKLLIRQQSVWAYLENRLLAPIGLRVERWNNAATGQPNLPSGAYLTAREWVKFGQLMLQQGKWDNRQIVRSDLLQMLLRGSSLNPAYGITFWLNAPGTGVGINTNLQNGIAPFAPDLFMAAGAGNQRLYVVPSQALVVVRFGRQADYSDAEFLKRLLRR